MNLRDINFNKPEDNSFAVTYMVWWIYGFIFFFIFNLISPEKFGVITFMDSVFSSLEWATYFALSKAFLDFVVHFFGRLKKSMRRRKQPEESDYIRPYREMK